MSPFPRGQPRTAGLLASACLGLLGVIHLELDEPSLPRAAQSMPSGAVHGSPVPDPQVDLEFALPPLGAYSEIGARPLFSPTRRPPPPATEAVPVPEEVPRQREQFLLRGTAVAGDSRVALLERRATGELLRAREGQTVEGWRVAAITPRTVVLHAGEDEDILEVEMDAAPPLTLEPLPAPSAVAVEPSVDEAEAEVEELEAEEENSDPGESRAAASPVER